MLYRDHQNSVQINWQQIVLEKAPVHWEMWPCSRTAVFICLESMLSPSSGEISDACGRLPGFAHESCRGLFGILLPGCSYFSPLLQGLCYLIGVLRVDYDLRN